MPTQAWAWHPLCSHLHSKSEDASKLQTMCRALTDVSGCEGAAKRDASANVMETLADGSPETESAHQDLSGLSASVRLAEEVGTLLGRGSILLRRLPQEGEVW